MAVVVAARAQEVDGVGALDFPRAHGEKVAARLLLGLLRDAAEEHRSDADVCGPVRASRAKEGVRLAGAVLAHGDDRGVETAAQGPIDHFLRAGRRASGDTARAGRKQALPEERAFADRLVAPRRRTADVILAICKGGGRCPSDCDNFPLWRARLLNVGHWSANYAVDDSGSVANPITLKQS